MRLPEAAAAAAPATVREAIVAGTGRLASAGCDTPRLDAELLLAGVLGVGRSRLVLDAAVPLARDAAAQYDALLRRREAREPVAYVLGRRAFRRLELQVDRRVLIPRPETELLVEAGLTLPAGARVADVGTGSGAVALALKAERPDLDVTGLDISPDAFAVARANAARLRLDVRFAVADLLDEEDYFAVLANLPYVPDGTSDLPPEVTRYEPAVALFAGADGLDLVRRLVGRLHGVSVVALEVGAGQAPPVAALLARSGFRSTERHRDLAGHERVVLGRR